MTLFETVNETVRFAKAPTAVGVVAHGDRALLVDSGLDENLARKVLNALEREGVRVAAVVNTHGHADHCGGNHFVVARTGARVAAPAYEHVFIERPSLEPWSLFGAPAPEALRGKFLQARPSPVHQVVEAEGEVDVAGFRVRFHALPGHSVHQMGVEVDGVLFAGDALLPERILDKYGISFAVDPPAARASARRLAEAAPEAVVCYHGGLVDDLEALVDANVQATEAVESFVRAALATEAASEERLFALACDRFGEPSSTELAQLSLATLRSYLAALERAGEARMALEGRRLVWRLADSTV